MPKKTDFAIKFARTPADIRAVQHLRYKVFIRELGGDGPMVDHAQMLEIDKNDAHYEHLMLVDAARCTGPENVVAVYRLLTQAGAQKIGAYYTEAEFDISALKNSDRKVLELGRSCVHPDYRGGAALLHLWNALAQYVLENDIDILFGAASFNDTDKAQLSVPLSYLYHNHLAPDDLRVTAISEHAVDMDLCPPADIDAKAALKSIPTLIKGYLRLGGFVGAGAFIDYAFNTTDICMIVDTKNMNTKKRSFYVKRQGGNGG